MYGICCTGGPKTRRLCVGSDVIEYPANGGVVFYYPYQRTFKYSDNYIWEKKKYAEEYLKRAREDRVKMFLGYDGFGKCKIVNMKDGPHGKKETT